MRDAQELGAGLLIGVAIGVLLGTMSMMAFAPPCRHDTPFTIDGGPTLHSPVPPPVWPDRDGNGGGEILYFTMGAHPQPVVVRYEREVRIGGE